MKELLKNAGPLCLCILATALVIQEANAMREAAVVDDALLPPLIGFIHPGAAAALAIGYVLALIVMICRSRGNKNAPACNRSCNERNVSGINNGNVSERTSERFSERVSEGAAV